MAAITAELGLGVSKFQGALRQAQDSLRGFRSRVQRQGDRLGQSLFSGTAAPAETLGRLGINPKKAGDAPIDAWLSESHQIPLTSWRKIGKDAAPTSVSGFSLDAIDAKYEEVPEFFLALGAGEPPEDFLFQGSGAGKPTRLLRATEIVLYKDRIATATDWTEGSGVDGSFAQFNVVYRLPPGARDRAYIRTVASYEPPKRPTVADRLMGDWQDVSYDPLHLATVYVLSPEGAASESAPDADWSPYVKHHVFWNLAHAVSIEPPRDSHDNLTFFTGLAGGLADAFVNQTLAIINDHNAAMSEFLGNRTVEGRYWTI